VIFEGVPAFSLLQVKNVEPGQEDDVNFFYNAGMLKSVFIRGK
jgi:hypothetical protein